MPDVVAVRGDNGAAELRSGQCDETVDNISRTCPGEQPAHRRDIVLSERHQVTASQREHEFGLDCLLDGLATRISAGQAGNPSKRPNSCGPAVLAPNTTRRLLSVAGEGAGRSIVDRA